MLIDVLERVGLDAMAQVDLGSRSNRNQPLFALGRMSFEVLRAVEPRAGGPRPRPDRQAAGLDAELRAARSARVDDLRPRAHAGRAGRAPADGRPARGHWRGSLRRVPLRCVYTDLDNTMLGRGASLLRDAEGQLLAARVRALEACHRAGVEVVIKSGRRKAQVLRGRAPDRPARLHLRDGLRAGGRRRGGVPDRRPRAAARPAPSTSRSRLPGRRALLLESLSRAGSSTTTPGTQTATSRTCSAARSTWRRCDAAARRARPRAPAPGRQRHHRAALASAAACDTVHTYHLIPARGGQGERGRRAHAPPRPRARGLHRDRRLARRPRGGGGGRPLLPGRRTRSTRDPDMLTRSDGDRIARTSRSPRSR